MSFPTAWWSQSSKRVRAGAARPEASTPEPAQSHFLPILLVWAPRASPDSKRWRNRLHLLMAGVSVSHGKGVWIQGSMIHWGPLLYQSAILPLIQLFTIGSCKHLFTSLCRFLNIYTLHFKIYFKLYYKYFPFIPFIICKSIYI